MKAIIIPFNLHDLTFFIRTHLPNNKETGQISYLKTRVITRGTRSPLGAGAVSPIVAPSGIGAGSGPLNRFRVRGRDGQNPAPPRPVAIPSGVHFLPTRYCG